jgi:iron complex outermembrane receptor protein
VNGEEQNLGATKTQGLDLVGSYGFQMPLPGRWSVDLSANLTTQYDVQFTPGGAYFNVLNTIGYPLRLRMRGDLGWAYGPLTTKLFVNYINGYNNTETTPTQSVSSYVTEDIDVIFNAGRVLQWNLARDLTFTFHVTNIGNVTPPYVNIPIGDGGGGYDATAASPLGRVISVGFGKKF